MKGQTHTFKQFNDEISDYYKHLKENKFSDDDIRKIFAPYFEPNLKKAKLATTVTLLTFLFATTAYLLTYSETVSWHLSAIGRIFLIKLLPFWDWTVLKNEKCLIGGTTESGEIFFNCDLCENINRIDVYDEISADFLKNRYLELDVPVIVRNKTKIWFSIDNLLGNEALANSLPCSLSTNVQNGVTTVKNLITKTKMFDSFFIHFQNCDFEVMKQFRSFTPKPPFLPVELSPVQYSWLLWNKDYNVTNYKPIKLVEKVTLMGQVTGNTVLRLIPRNNCHETCPQLDIKLERSEFLLFSSLWNLEYKPQDGDNVAAILEMH